MGMLSAQTVNAAKAPEETGRTLESLLVQKLLQSSGAFKGSSEPGAQLHNDLFVETLAEAVTNAGGFGLAEVLKKELTGPTGVAAPQERPGGPPKELSAGPPHPLPGENPQASPGSPDISKRALIAYGRRAEETVGRNP